MTDEVEEIHQCCREGSRSEITVNDISLLFQSFKKIYQSFLLSLKTLFIYLLVLINLCIVLY